MADRPSDITLPEGWTWELVERARAKWHIADNMIPVARAPGVVAWGTINFERQRPLEALIEKYLNARTVEEANQLSVMVEIEADRVGYDNHDRLYRVHTAVERRWA